MLDKVKGNGDTGNRNLYRAMQRLKMCRLGTTSLLRVMQRLGGRLLLAGLSVALLTLALASASFAGSTTLVWNTNSEPDLTGYKVHYGTASGKYTMHLDVGNVLSRTITGLADGTTYYFVATAYDSVGNESGYSNEVSVTPSAAPLIETVSTPLAPSGPTTGTTGVSYSYTASGAVASTGDSVQYRFSWADGTDSGWLAAGVTKASKTWSAAGTYTLVSVEARCATHTSVISQASPAISVTISAAATETVSAPTKPSGPTSGVAGGTYTYTTGGSVSSAGHAVEYRFAWSDGSESAWLPSGSASAVKSWSAAGTYTLVKAEARCATHPSIVSSASAALTVVIAAGAAETVSAPSAPAGTTEGSTGILYTFSSGGAVSSSGDGLSYRFHWGDGTTSDWIAGAETVSATKSWSVAGTYEVQTEVACATHTTVGSFSTTSDVAIADSTATPTVATVVWTRSDTGQAFLWELDPVSNVVKRSAWLYSKTGVGSPWQATSYTRVDATTGYVLWTRGDTGTAALWKVNPSTGAMVSAAYLKSRTGVGAPWQATGYAHVNDTTGYVLWTRSDSGKAALWKIDPSVPDVIPIVSSAYVGFAAGVGAPWQATSYTHVDDKTGYVLWTRGDTGKAALWKVDPSVPDVIPMTSSAYLSSSAGVGSPWQATSYVHVNDTTGYVLWTCSDSGKAALWKVDPSVSGTIPIVSSGYIYSSTGIGSPWQATGYAR